MNWIARRDESPVPPGTTEEQWREWGRVLRESAAIVSWKIARWLHYGEHFHLTCDEIADILQVPSNTVRKARRVSQHAFELIDAHPELSRLPFGAFAATSATSLPHTYRVAILKEAAEKGLTVQDIYTRQKDWLVKINRPKSNERGRVVTARPPAQQSRSGNRKGDKVAVYLTEDEWRKLCLLARQSEYTTGVQLLKGWISEGWAALFPDTPIEADERGGDGSEGTLSDLVVFSTEVAR